VLLRVLGLDLAAADRRVFEWCGALFLLVVDRVDDFVVVDSVDGLVVVARNDNVEDVDSDTSKIGGLPLARGGLLNGGSGGATALGSCDVSDALRRSTRSGNLPKIFLIRRRTRSSNLLSC